jgi:hypothetical protein
MQRSGSLFRAAPLLLLSVLLVASAATLSRALQPSPPSPATRCALPAGQPEPRQNAAWHTATTMTTATATPAGIFEAWPGQALAAAPSDELVRCVFSNRTVYLLGDSQTGQLYNVLLPQLIRLFGTPQQVRTSTSRCNRTDFFALQSAPPPPHETDGFYPLGTGPLKYASVFSSLGSSSLLPFSVSLPIPRCPHLVISIPWYYCVCSLSLSLSSLPPSIFSR